MNATDAAESLPDKAFSLGFLDSVEARLPLGDVDTRPSVVDRIAARLRELGPAGWQQADAVFSMTVTDAIAQVFYSDTEHVATVQADSALLDLAREHRDQVVADGQLPWWRLAVSVTGTGAVEVHPDHGERPFPEGYLLPPQAYRADLTAFPRPRLPVWLAAYVGHDDRQSRPPRRAARQDRADGVQATRVTDAELPPLPAVWSRWAVLAAAFAAVGSTSGPRLRPATAWYEDPSGSGSTLCRLPRGRAVLSGGQSDAQILDLVYNHGRDMPDFYAGAPDWVTDVVLNPRAAGGLLSFCYWWDSDAWYRGTWSSSAETAVAVPPIADSEVVSEIIARLSDPNPSAELTRAARQLVAAAAAGTVGADRVAAVFDPRRDDVDSALHLCVLADLAT